ncbi:Anti-anti-sigma regulatory factor (antagonist of anti-sigma factor) [Mycobacterium rhizamassiliense]|uniref:Anti-anti-sigma regulatory factor (Antagonist of anti-sigma factor) n=2 Tax=Mycobacterium rhizamassiliense TaxID=1841860 RepID=A0A2U3NM87_9MYCO|nr:Anti-anti-sigma regulatory factor (antagonist of anti-sigma factor) [Mycobacterium rhizamassiliense]
MAVAQSWQRCRTAQFSAQWHASGAVMTVDGELDAANADQLATYVQRNVGRTSRVILDLRGLEFIGTAGFSALHRINVVCSAAQVHWAMAPSEAVSRLLRVCDPDGTLPVTGATDEPLLKAAHRGDDQRPLLQLVT